MYVKPYTFIVGRWEKDARGLTSAKKITGKPIRQRHRTQALLQRIQFLRDQQAIPRPVPVEAQAVVAQACGLPRWPGWLVSAAER